MVVSTQTPRVLGGTMGAQSNTTPPSDEQEKGIAKAAGSLFIGILLALALKATLDTFFKDASAYAAIGDAWNSIKANVPRTLILLGQLLVFLFTLVRFYWGSLRYYEETPNTQGTAEVALGLGGAIFLFSSFYVTGLLIRTTRLFYV